MSNLEDLKEGDFVCVLGGTLTPHIIQKGVVDRVTKTQIISKEIRYRKSDGSEISGSTYNRRQIEVWRDDHERIFQKQNLTRATCQLTEKLKSLANDFTKEDYDELLSLYKTIKIRIES